MAGENADVNMVAGVDDNMDGAPMVDDHEDEGSEVDFQGLEGESDRTSQCTTLELGAEEPEDKGPKVQWEYTFLPIKNPEASINNIELGGKANLYHRTWEGNSPSLCLCIFLAGIISYIYICIDIYIDGKLTFTDCEVSNQGSPCDPCVGDTPWLPSFSVTWRRSRDFCRSNELLWEGLQRRSKVASMRASV